MGDTQSVACAATAVGSQEATGRSQSCRLSHVLWVPHEEPCAPLRTVAWACVIPGHLPMRRLSASGPGLPWREGRPLAATTRVLTGLSLHFRKAVVSLLGPSRSA